MQVFGELECYVVSCLQQSVVAGFEGDHALYAGFEYNLVGSRSVPLLGGWAGGSVYSWHPILFGCEREDSVRPAEKGIFVVVVYPKELTRCGL